MMQRVANSCDRKPRACSSPPRTPSLQYLFEDAVRHAVQEALVIVVRFETGVGCFTWGTEQTQGCSNCLQKLSNGRPPTTCIAAAQQMVRKRY